MIDLDWEICERARLSRDHRFDGKFFTGVLTTGIFCRPICPARPPKRENVTYFPTATAAVEAGLRPCLRCRPEAAPGSPGWRGSPAVVERALGLIRRGALNELTVDEFAEKLGIGSRHMRRLFKQYLGATPVEIARTQRALFAKQLLTETDLNITDVAMASGFGSIRQFNDVFLAVYKASPSEIRRKLEKTGNSSGASCVLELTYRPGFDWKTQLSFIATRVIPGVETITGDRYRRTFRLKGRARGWMEISDCPERSRLILSIFTTHMEKLMEIQQRVRHMFDLDVDITPIHDLLKQDPLLAPVVKTLSGIRLPGTWDPFEFCVRAILGQQISVKAATTLAGRIVSRYGPAGDPDFPEGLTHFFPTPEELLQCDLSGIGITGKRQETILGLTKAVNENRVCLTHGQELPEFIKSFTSLPGIGEWTANYVAMRALRMPDAFPDSDLGVRKALANGKTLPSTKEVLKRAEAWRPWRAYAALYLWKVAEQKAREES